MSKWIQDICCECGLKVFRQESWAQGSIRCLTCRLYRCDLFGALDDIKNIQYDALLKDNAESLEVINRVYGRYARNKIDRRLLAQEIAKHEGASKLVLSASKELLKYSREEELAKKRNGDRLVNAIIRKMRLG